MKSFLLVYLAGFIIIAGSGCAPVPLAATPTRTGNGAEIIFFDDFTYAAREEMTANGWVLREGTGWPGVPGARFRADNVSLVDAPDLPGNRLLRMTSSTDGTAEGTFQTQLCQQRKFFEGTYAARVQFRDEPEFGTDGDQIVETFYAITPYERPMALDYSEMDFEYLPNGGWGSSPLTLFVTTWETVQIEPWNAVNVSTGVSGSLAGWHTLVAQVSGGEVRYFIDGKLVAQHGDPYYPDAPMSLNFNLWFINGGLAGAEDLREYHEDIDWVFYARDSVLSQADIEAVIASLRDGEVAFRDDIPPWTPALTSPCDL